MAIKHNHRFAVPDPQKKRGFALLIAIIFMSVMLTFGMTLGSLGYKQQVLASGAIGSQYAFYVADAALECVLYADQQQNRFEYNPDVNATPPTMSCGESAPILSEKTIHTPARWVLSYRFLLDGGKHCADVMVSKPADMDSGTTYLYAQGYNVSCATVANPGLSRFSTFSSRGLKAKY